ncbi:MAG: tetratricopeptide repeat protein [Vicinamibacteria bacterium]
MIHAVSAMVLAFKLWLVTDALRRGEACYWPWIIFFVPLGDVVYFFLIKIDDYSLAWITGLFRKPVPVGDLELQYRRTPSFSNRVALAGAFYREGRYAEAAEHYAAALEQQPSDPEVLYGLGLTRIAQQDYAAGATHLASLVEKDKAYGRYAAWPPLAHALFGSGRSDDCLSALRRLVDENPRMEHKMLLARYLSEASKLEEAREVLQETLAEHLRSPRFLRRRNFRNALTAKSMLKSIANQPSELEPAGAG